MQTFIFGRNKQRLHEEHLGNFLRGSIRLAAPEREKKGHCCARAHVAAAAVSQKFRSPAAAAHSGNPQISEWRRRRVSQSISLPFSLSFSHFLSRTPNYSRIAVTLGPTFLCPHFRAAASVFESDLEITVIIPLLIPNGRYQNPG